MISNKYINIKIRLTPEYSSILTQGSEMMFQPENSNDIPEHKQKNQSSEDIVIRAENVNKIRHVFEGGV